MKLNMKIILSGGGYHVESSTIMQIKDGKMWNKRAIKFPSFHTAFIATHIEVNDVRVELPRSIPVHPKIPTRIGANQLRIRVQKGI